MRKPPLFVPLKTRWFRAFEAGTKTIEYRIYGARWNERTCTVGRAVILCHGYRGERLRARVKRFVIRDNIAEIHLTNIRKDKR